MPISFHNKTKSVIISQWQVYPCSLEWRAVRELHRQCQSEAGKRARSRHLQHFHGSPLLSGKGSLLTMAHVFIRYRMDDNLFNLSRLRSVAKTSMDTVFDL